MSIDQDKKEFVAICEAMERELPHASRLELATALAFSLWQVVKGSREAMALWKESK
jgi:hypothetical protein